MKRWLIVPLAALSLLVTSASDCSGGGSAGLPSSAPPSAAAPASAVPPVARANIVLKGVNATVSNPLDVPAGHYRVAWKADGNSNFSVTLTGQSDDLLVNTILSNPHHDWQTGEALFSSAGGSFIVTVDTGTSLEFDANYNRVNIPVSWELTFVWLA